MEWSDEAFVLAVRPHGENAAVLTALTRDHGRHAGLVAGRNSLGQRGILLPGNELRVRWRARLAEHLGHWRCEPARLRAGGLFDDAARLAGLSAACALLEGALAERQPYPGLFASLTRLLDSLGGGSAWLGGYVTWELNLLRELGFGLDLTACAATGAVEDLRYVSPKTGRAVSGAAGAPYRDRLLPLPAFLVARARRTGAVEASVEEILQGLAVTGYFLERHVFAEKERALPPARDRLLDCITRYATRSCGI
ncbi:MAG: DNA repair protein RecO [Alphaproteobacteria bacterium]